MATQEKPATEASKPSPNFAPGAFPFPLIDGSQEAPCLTWVRNHANYMAVRGFFDYFRSASVLLRGIVLNFLIFLPALLVVAIVLAYLHHWMLRNPFLLTLWALAIAGGAIVLFPIGVQLFKISSHRRSVDTGSYSSVRLRDLYERWFGRLLLLVLAVALLESLPWVLESVRDWLRRGELRWQGGLAAVAATLSLLSGSDKLLSVLSGAKRTLAMGLIGLLGLLAPFLVILYATDYLLYGFPPSPYVSAIPVIAAACFVVAVIIAICIGVSRRVFKRHEFRVLAGLALVLVLLLWLVNLAGDRAVDGGKAAQDALHELLNPIKDLASGLEGIEGVEELDVEVAELHGRFVSVYRQLKQATDAADQALEDQDRAHWNNLTRSWGNRQSQWQASRTYFSTGARLLPLTGALLAAPEHQLEELRLKIASVARDELDPWVRHLKPDEDCLGSASAGAQLAGVGDGLACSWVAFLESALQPDTFNSLELRDQFVEEIRNRSPRSPSREELEVILCALEDNRKANANDLIAKLQFGKYGGLVHDEKKSLQLKEQLAEATIGATALFVFLLAVVILLGCWLTVDVNLTSIHGLFRDRLASAFLVRKHRSGKVEIEQDLDLHHICRYEAGSIAPYHLINVALNLQASSELRIRDRKSDFFIFSKRFTGGQRTGYCRSETLEQVFPQMSLASAMAISAGAASPNMGRATSPLLVAFMTLLNIRLGYWAPNPGLLEQSATTTRRWPWNRRVRESASPPGFTFAEVFAEELREIQKRRDRVYRNHPGRRRLEERARGETVEHGLVGIAFSGGGIRSAALNLGITQALHERGVFDHLDYMSTVSGGGYLGSSISALMRSAKLPLDKARTTPNDPGGCSQIEGTVTVGTTATESTEQVVTVETKDEQREYRFTRFDSIVVKTGDKVKAGQRLIQRRDSIGERFRWRVRPVAFLREMVSKLDETHAWVNLSDGGHLENLATMELLRRRCRYIIVGDAEADQDLHFAGLATLMRYAYLDLGIEIDIDLDPIRLRKADESDAEATVSGEHWAIGRIRYPKLLPGGKPEEGYLLYLKSSYTGDDESEVIREYRHRNPTFPHETTADQFFGEGQFEAYRALGQHIAERALDGNRGTDPSGKKPRSESPVPKMGYAELETWFQDLWKNRKKRRPAQNAVQP